MNYDVRSVTGGEPAFNTVRALDLSGAQGWLDPFKANPSPPLTQLVYDGAAQDPREAGWYDMIWLDQDTSCHDGATDPANVADPDHANGQTENNVIREETVRNRWTPSDPYHKDERHQWPTR